jgi:DNA-binding NarL/FixJ family response regulator
MRKARLLLADDHAIFLEGLARLLESEFEVAGKAEDGRQMLEMSCPG